jgi:16S rRNA (uracil1498-N3)-methyltransferase
VNLILLHPHELAADGRVRLHERRADHLVHVLKVAPGDVVRIGLLDGPLGEGAVLAVEPASVTLHCTFAADAPTRSDDVLLLAVPRPKILLRCLESAAALGFGHVALFRTWRVDKSHLHAQAMHDDVIAHHLQLGLEQARRTAMPSFSVHPLFRPFVEDVVDDLTKRTRRFVAHPTAELRTAALPPSTEPFAVAIGPEGGFLPFEVDLLSGHGFTPVRCGDHPLRVETALAVAHGQLDLLRRIATA